VAEAPRAQIPQTEYDRLAESPEAICLDAERAALAGKRKYNVAPRHERIDRGRVYDSKAEGRYAARLDADPDGRLWTRQPIVQLGEDTAYRHDFLVLAWGGGPEETARFVDVKGVETQAFKRSKKRWAEYGKAPLEIVKAVRGVEINTEINGGAAPLQSE